MTKARRSARDRQLTREVLTGRGINDFPTRKSAGLRLERFWKEQRWREKQKEAQVGTYTVHGRTDMQEGG